MASRAGPRATGTDGSDFVHRERVELRHQISSVLKPRVRGLSFLHSLLLVIAGARVFTRPACLPAVATPELIWLASGLAPMAALMSLPRNRAWPLRIAILFHLACGLVPIAWLVWRYADDLHDFINTRRDSHHLPWANLPYTPVLYLFLSVCLQVHGFSLFYYWRLLSAWAPRPATSASAASAAAAATSTNAKKRS